jgi:hypothetical protein
LLTLKGHLSAITDLQYSYRGDRILSASQKDGVVRIWSWARDPCAPLDYSRDSTSRQPSHVLIKLSNPKTALTQANAVGLSRRRPLRSTPQTVSCDVATWIHDDSKVITSQCELAKANGSEILPGSQYIFVWDSRTGHCLLGISGGHTMQCPLVIPHPIDYNIVCTGGADGMIKLWDLDSGKCFYLFLNTLDHGPMDPRDVGTSSGFLDGTFSADGLYLVLTDELGRAVVFDCLSTDKKSMEEPPAWMKEQYFANDYYEVVYDTSGYCVERGSELPPHLAPRGVRCSYAGVPFSIKITETFKQMLGPLPMSEYRCRWMRHESRRLGTEAKEEKFSIPGNIVGQFDAAIATIIQADGSMRPNDQYAAPKITHIVPSMSTLDAGGVANNNRSDMSQLRQSGPRLSSNWRWRDYNDVLREEANDAEDHVDSDDEDFQLTESSPRRAAAASARSQSDSEDLDIEDVFVNEASPSSSARPKRRQYIEDDDSSDEDEQIMSTNNDPFGPFIADYDAHLFKLPSLTTYVQRKWLHRTESNSSYDGRKAYTPQVGDSVVYIPRAHYETITKFPSLTAPWQSWPEGVEWPVVQCRVCYMRFRFPYKAYKSQVRSIIAILTLEITGIPEIDHNRRFLWPKPSFIAPNKKHVFEVSVTMIPIIFTFVIDIHNLILDCYYVI